MKHFIVHGQHRSDYSIGGESLPDAIRTNFKTIADDAHIGNAAGYILEYMCASYTKGILGGRGGVELFIKWRGQKSAAPNIGTSIVWIFADQADLPEPHIFTLGEKHDRTE